MDCSAKAWQTMIGSPRTISPAQWGHSDPTSRGQAINDLAPGASKKSTTFCGTACPAVASHGQHAHAVLHREATEKRTNKTISIEYKKEMAIAE
jgi:hypothetical protein